MVENYKVLDKESINDLRSDKGYFNKITANYLLEFLGMDWDSMEKGWVKDLEFTEPITTTKEYERIYDLRNIHLKKGEEDKF